jgi:hypothetical protein
MKEKSIYRYEKLFDKISKPLSQKKRNGKLLLKSKNIFLKPIGSSILRSAN